MKEKIIDRLISIKSIVTLGVIGAFIYLSVTGKITPDQFIPIVTMIVTFYFAKKDE